MTRLLLCRRSGTASILALIVAPLLMLAPALAMAAESPAIATATTPFSIDFEVEKSGVPLGETHFSLAAGDQPNCYVYSGTANPNFLARMFLGDVKEESRFCIVDGQVRPDYFSHRQAGKKDKSYTLTFDWQNDQVHYHRADGKDKTYPITPGVQDPLSLQIAARAWVASQIAAGHSANDLGGTTFKLVDDHGVKDFKLESAPGGDIKVGAGHYDTLRVARVGDADHPLALWLARKADWIPVQVQTGAADKQFTMTATALSENDSSDSSPSSQ